VTDRVEHDDEGALASASEIAVFVEQEST